MTIDTIITDLDDTLLDEEGRISPYTLDVMRQCLRRGIRVIPSSGRAQPSMEPFMRQLDTHLPYIACNGAQLVNADHSILDEMVMPAKTAREICAFWQSAGCYMQVYRGDSFYYAQECEPSRGYKKSSGMPGVAVGNLVDFITFDTPKLLGIGDPELVAKLYESSVEKFAQGVVFTISKPFFCEATCVGATKGEALRRLAERMNIKPEHTLVFGDSLNDLSMLEFTTNSVAMGNGRDEVKRVARYACRPNSQDGLARFVEEHVLTL